VAIWALENRLRRGFIPALRTAEFIYRGHSICSGSREKSFSSFIDLSAIPR
jgi:hypothetical protein